MGLLEQLGQAAQNPGKRLKKQMEDYIVFEPSIQQLTLKAKTVELLCQKTVQRVDGLTALAPEAQTGLLATFEQPPITAKVHFTPETIIFNGGVVEGRLRLLQKPQIESSSPFYGTLIAGWSTFLGGYIPNQALPEGVKLDGDFIDYTLPKQQLRLIDALFHNLQDGSTLTLVLEHGELRIKSSVAMHWRDMNLLSLIQLFTAIAGKKS